MIAALCGLALSAHALDRPAPLPDPLPARPLALPAPDVRELSNGLKVLVATNAEVPLWEARLVLGVGQWNDPEGKEGLTAAMFDMMDEGAGDLSGQELAAALKRLAGSVHASLSRDTATISVSGISRNLEPTLDLWADVVTRPTFPEKEWEIVQQRMVADHELSLEDPVSLGTRAWFRLLWGDAYLGRAPTTASLKSLTREDCSELYGRLVGPEAGVVLVGGDVTADQIVPLLEARLGSWAPAGVEVVPGVPEPRPVDEPVLYFIDKPGASQSVIRAGTFIGSRTDPDHFSLEVANHAFGRAFTGRVNMNLREEKGWTYGARCSLVYRHGPGQLACSTSVRTDVTADALAELRRELGDVLGDRPLTSDELAPFRASLVYGFPGEFETTSRILDEAAEIWRYDLPADWTTTTVEKLERVRAEDANAALRNRISTDHVFWLVVGDREAVWEGLRASGLPMVELDRDGRPLGDQAP